MTGLLAVACGPLPIRADGGQGGGFSFGGGFGGGLNLGGGASGGSGGSTGGGTANCSAAGSLVLTQLHGTFSAASPGGTSLPGGFDSSTRRAFTLPQLASGSLQKLATLRLLDAGTALPDGGSRAYVEWLPVTGTVPTGRLTASSFDEQSNVLTGVYHSRSPPRFDVVQLQVTHTEARFSTLNQTNMPDAGGLSPYQMQGTSAALGVQMGDGLRTLTMSGTQATWGPAVPAPVFSDLSGYDRSSDRVISIGSTTFVPPNMVVWNPTVHVRQATSPTWSPVNFSGMGLSTIGGMPPMGFVAYDSVDDRLVIAGLRPSMTGMNYEAVAIEANMRTRAWRDLGRISSVTGHRPFFYDRAHRQVFGHDFAAYSLVPGQELTRSSTPLTGGRPPENTSSGSTGVRLPDGRVLINYAGLMTFTPTTGEWQKVPAAVPSNQSMGATLAWDSVGQRALLLFGSTQLGSMTNTVLALSADGTALTPLVTTGTAPSGRTWASALAVGNSLVVAGGYTGTTDSGDVFALDLTTLSWRRVGQVTPRIRSGLIAREGSVVVVGGHLFSGTFVSAVERVDLVSGRTDPVNVTGTVTHGGLMTLAPFNGGLAGFDPPGARSTTSSSPFVEFTFTDSGATWKTTDSQMDLSYESFVAVPGTSCNEALFLGRNSFRVTR